MFAQVYESATPLSEASILMEQERNFIRQQLGGSDILVQAARLGKAAKPIISLIFDEDRAFDYTSARCSVPAEKE